MQLIKSGTAKLKGDTLIKKAEFVMEKMTGNAAFPTPTPTLASITAAITKYADSSKQAVSGAHEAIKTAQLDAKALRALLSNLAKYVNSASNGDLNTALTSGFEAAKGHEPIVKLDAPENLRVMRNFKRHEISLRWKPVHGARLYRVFMADDKGEWNALDLSSKASFTVIDLESYKEYSFMVTAIGAAGESANSQIVTGIAA